MFLERFVCKYLQIMVKVIEKGMERTRETGSIEKKTNNSFSLSLSRVLIVGDVLFGRNAADSFALSLSLSFRLDIELKNDDVNANMCNAQ